VASNVEIVRALSEPFASVDVGAIDWRAAEIRELLAQTYTEDVELRTLQSGVGLGLKESYYGLDGTIEYLASWLEPFDEYHVEWVDFVDGGGDCVLVTSHQHGIGGTSGARVEIDVAFLLQVRDGRISKSFQYDTLEEAQEAVAQLAAQS
jgi:ketosteroid isomerase-like protein